MGRSVASYIESDARLPRVIEAREQFEEIEKAVSQLWKASHDPVISGFLDNAQPTRMDVATLHSALAQIGLRASLAKKALPQGRQGRVPAVPLKNGDTCDIYLTAKQFCAMVIVEAWTVVRGKPPPLNSDDASAAASLLWKAAGGPPRGWAEAPVWRKQFQAVADIGKTPGPDPRKDRQLMIRHQLESNVHLYRCNILI
jgi:hypothetical protein